MLELWRHDVRLIPGRGLECASERVFGRAVRDEQLSGKPYIVSLELLVFGFGVENFSP